MFYLFLCVCSNHQRIGYRYSVKCLWNVVIEWITQYIYLCSCHWGREKQHRKASPKSKWENHKYSLINSAMEDHCFFPAYCYQPFSFPLGNQLPSITGSTGGLSGLGQPGSWKFEAWINLTKMENGSFFTLNSLKIILVPVLSETCLIRFYSYYMGIHIPPINCISPSSQWSWFLWLLLKEPL